jgi:hypothetical protein
MSFEALQTGRWPTHSGLGLPPPRSTRLPGCCHPCVAIPVAAMFTLDILVMHGLLVDGSRTVRPVQKTAERSRRAAWERHRGRCSDRGATLTRLRRGLRISCAWRAGRVSAVAAQNVTGRSLITAIA